MSQKRKISKEDFDRMDWRLKLKWLDRARDGEVEIDGVEAGSVYDDDSECVVCYTPFLDDDEE